MDSHFSQNIKRIREKWKLSQTDFGKLFGATRGQVMQWENRGSVPNDETIETVCKICNILKHDLFNQVIDYGNIIGLPENIKNSIGENVNLISTKNTEEKNKKLIPYYDIDFMAGTTEVFSDGHETPSYLIDINPFNDCDLALPIFGDSMYPQYQNGDIVLCRDIKDKSIIPLGEAFLIVTSEHRMLKYLRKGPRENTLMAVSENAESYDPFPIEIDKILKLYIVKGIIKRKAI